MPKVTQGGGGGGGRNDNDNSIYWTLPPPPSHLLEITIISAQDLQPMSRRARIYATAWVDSNHKLSTQVDGHGCTNPTWNDKFVFRVDDSFLRSYTSAVTINIHARKRMGKDPVIGTVRVLLSAINPSSSTKFVALLVRRPKSLRPQGVVNLGVELLDDYMKRMPTDSAFILKDMMDSPNRNFDTNENHKERRRNDSFDNNLNRNASVTRKVIEKEAFAVQLKLDKWKIDLSPASPMPTKKKASCCYRPSVQD